MTQHYLSLRPEKIINEEVRYDSTKIITSRTDKNGNITYVNEAFTEVSGYTQAELFGEPHSIIRHPDMPQLAFQKLWEYLKRGENFHLVIKNLAKDGRYYWVATDYSTNFKDGDIIGYTSRRRIAPKSIVDKIEPLYQTILGIEKVKGLEYGELYLKSYLEEEVKMPYNDFIINLFEEEFENEKSRITSKKRRKVVNKTLTWFFTSDYDS